MKLSNHNKPTNPTTVKIFAAITLITLLFPSWFNTMPGVTELQKIWVEWVLKGIDFAAMIVAIFTNGGYKSPYNKDL